jgi:hypothetical protein
MSSKLRPLFLLSHSVSKRAQNWFQDHGYTREHDGKVWFVDKPGEQDILRICTTLCASHLNGQARASS